MGKNYKFLNSSILQFFNSSIPLATIGNFYYSRTPMTKPSPAENQTEIPFEAALKELEAIVRKLEGGAGDLESSIADYVRGTELKDYCQKKLESARLKVESILQSKDGTVTTKPFDNI